MCFSAQASFISAGILGTIGLVTIKKNQIKKLVPLSAAPILFATQQALEGIVWLTLNSGNNSGLLHKLSVSGFIFFAGIVWPTVIPIYLYFIEKHKTRKLLLLSASLAGVFFATSYLILWNMFGMQAEALNGHISYSFIKQITNTDILDNLENIGLIMYLGATAGAMFISSIKYMWALGLLTAIALIISQIFFRLAYGSVWCFFAAIISLLIYFIIDKNQK